MPALQAPYDQTYTSYFNENAENPLQNIQKPEGLQQALWVLYSLATVGG